MKKQRILSGIQPTGEMHIGNYLGALRDLVKLQDEYESFVFIADLHSLTENYEPGLKGQQILDALIACLASGLNPEKTTIFVQSQIPAHSELAWIFNTITPVGELERMTQYKDKALKQKNNVNVGLLDYPVLMAADILLYKPQLVPVGHDQIQHLEMTNSIAHKFNNRFGQTFEEIKPYAKRPLRIMSLSHPEKKMSKSDPGSYIGIFDEPDMIRKKLSRAVTATDAPEGKMPKGVENLFLLLQEFGTAEIYANFMNLYQQGTIKYSDLKSELAELIIKAFAPFRAKREELITDQQQINAILELGRNKALTVANQTMTEIKNKIGLI
ncbi:MAG: tryptophan--tRNA ligase [Candidatus Saccharibacteria bacterium]